MPGWGRRDIGFPALFCILLAGASATAGEQPALVVAPGDVLNVTILEEPSLGRETKVDASGRITLPKLGNIEASGRTLEQVRSEIEAELKAQDVVFAPTVIVEFVSYRPVYVDGVVNETGAITFEPGLTVRKALVLAGGLTRDNPASRLPADDMLKLNSDWRANAFALIEVHSRIARLEAELAGSKADPAAGPAPSVAAPAAATEVRTLDRQLAESSIDLHDREKSHVQDLLDLTDFLLGVLGDQARSQETERDLQKTEVENARELSEKGMLPLPRLRELEREEARLSRDILEVKAYTARARQDKETLAYQLAASDEKRTVELQEQIRDAVLERNQLEMASELLASQILAAGIAVTGLDSLTKRDPHFVIHRDAADGEQAIEADMATPLYPGDVLEVSYEEGPPA